MTILTTLALQNASTLRAFHHPEDPGCPMGYTLKDLAEKVSRDRSNLSKALTALEEAGLLSLTTRDPISGRLTADGIAMVAALDRADGIAPGPSVSLPDGFIAVRHDQIGQDPDNARKTSGLSPEAIRDMADSLFDKGVLQQPELRRNPDHPASGPEYLLTMGERRWRGWGLNIELGRWPADKLIICKLENRSEVERLEAGLVENLQRADISNLEMAEGFLVLHDRHLQTPQEIAKKVGKTSRFVQIAIKVAREATAEDKAKYVESEKAYAEGKAANLPGIRRLFTWEDLRNTVKTAKYVTALEKRGRLTLMVAELAHKAETDPAAFMVEHDAHERDVTVTEINVPPGGGYWGEAQDLGVVVDHREDGKIYGGVTDVAREWLKDAGFDKDPKGWTKTLAIEALGPMPVRLAEEAAIWNTQFLNPPKPPPAPVAPPVPAVDTAPLAPPRDKFAEQIRQVNAEMLEEGETFVKPTDLGGSVMPPTVTTAAPAAPAGPNLTSEQFLTLVEVAHKISMRPVQARGGAITGCDVLDFHSGPQAKTAQELVIARMLMFVQSPNGNAFLATLTQAAWNYLGVSMIDDETLEGHRHENLDFEDLTAFETSGETYQTTWLRDPVKVSAPKAVTAEIAPEEPVAAGLGAPFEADGEDHVEERECPSCNQVFDTATEDKLCPACASEAVAGFGADAADFLGEDEDETDEADGDAELEAFDIAGAFAGRWDFILICRVTNAITTAQLEPFGVIVKDEADGYAVGESLAGSGRFEEVKLCRRSGKLLVHWGEQ